MNKINRVPTGENQMDDKSKIDPNKFKEALAEALKADPTDPIRRRSFVRSDISAANFGIDPEGKIVATSMDKNGNLVYKDKFGNIKSLTKEELDAGILPDLSYQEKYVMEQGLNEDGELTAEISLSQDAFYDQFDKTLNDIITGNESGRGLPLGKKQGENTLPALSKVEQLREAFNQNKFKKEADIVAAAARVAAAKENIPEKLDSNLDQTKKLKTGIKTVMMCGECEGILDKTTYNFCPHCGVKLGE